LRKIRPFYQTVQRAPEDGIIGRFMTLTIRRWDDPRSWNAFVATVPHVHFQQSWQWGELAPQLGGEAVRIGALCDGELRGAAQVFVNRLAGGGRTMLYIPRGPALAEQSARLYGPLLEAVRDLGRERSSLGVRIETNLPAGDERVTSILSSMHLRPSFPPSQPRSSWMLDVSKPEDDLLAGMKQKTRYNVRLAAKKGVQVTEADPDDLEEFYALYRVTAERDDFFVHSLDIYRRMFALFREAGMFSMLFARFQGELIAAVTLIHLGDTCWYLHGASSNEHRNLMATYLLQWEAIKRAREWGCRLYDFRAVPDLLQEDQDMYGVYRFKEGFGGYQYTTMHTYSQAFRPGFFGLWQAYFSGRFALTNWRRRRAGLPLRQFA
jgi:peptidoglycan pentaglycine glycine transferase (the first glycine)